MKYGSAVILTLLFPVVAFGDVYIYPTKGQGQQQQSKDRYECHTWAVQQTGFDPSRTQAAAPPPSSPQPGGEIVKGAARGALVGTVGGAIAGDAGRGAAAGAAMGGLLGGMRKMDNSRAQQQQQAQQQSANSQQAAGYDRAMGACLEGRGYTVR
jgi:predicted lipid-binding transport protein (Tim44 family)